MSWHHLIINRLEKKAYADTVIMPTTMFNSNQLLQSNDVQWSIALDCHDNKEGEKRAIGMTRCHSLIRR